MDSKAVPQVTLEPRYLAVPLKVDWSCHCCPFTVSAMSDAHLLAAMDDHAAYVLATKDRATDDHFHEQRMNDLLAR